MDASVKLQCNDKLNTKVCREPLPAGQAGDLGVQHAALLHDLFQPCNGSPTKFVSPVYVCSFDFDMVGNPEWIYRHI